MPTSSQSSNGDDNDTNRRANKQRRFNSPPASPAKPIQPGQNDVLMGRGRPYQNSTGNKRMLRIVSRFKEEYAAKRREQKRAFVETVLDEVLKGGTRFLRRNDNEPAEADESPWEEVDRLAAAEKVWHALRDKKEQKNEKGKVKEEPTIPVNAGTPRGAREPAAAILHNSHRLIGNLTPVASQGISAASKSSNTGVATGHPSPSRDTISRLAGLQPSAALAIPGWDESPKSSILTTAPIPAPPPGQSSTFRQASSQGILFRQSLSRGQDGSVPRPQPGQDDDPNSNTIETLLNSFARQEGSSYLPCQGILSDRAPSGSGTLNSSQSEGRDLTLAIQILDSALRSLIQELSRARMAIQVATVVASTPMPSLQGGLSPEAVEMVMRLALPATGPPSAFPPAPIEQREYTEAALGQILAQFQPQSQSQRQHQPMQQQEQPADSTEQALQRVLDQVLAPQQQPPQFHERQHFVSSQQTVGSAADSHQYTSSARNGAGNNDGLTWATIMSLCANSRGNQSPSGGSTAASASVPDHRSDDTTSHARKKK